MLKKNKVLVYQKEESCRQYTPKENKVLMYQKEETRFACNHALSHIITSTLTSPSHDIPKNIKLYNAHAKG
jgi:hypothetical protein